MSFRNLGWDNIYGKYGRYYDEPYFPRFPELVEQFKADGVQRILDLGCGNGRHAAHFTKYGMPSVGTDIAFSGLQLAKGWEEELKVPVPVALSDMHVGIPFASNTFDAVFSANVIHHGLLAQVRVTIADIYRVLKPGGQIFIGVIETLKESELGEEIEPNTYAAPEDEEDQLIHYMFTEHTLRYEFRMFEDIEIDHRGNNLIMIIAANKPL